MEHHITLSFALVGLLGICAQWLAWRVRLPAIVLLTIFGIFVGPIFGFIQPSKDFGEIFDPIIRIGVAVIMFEGGLSLRFHELKQAGAGVARLVTFGVLLSFPLGSLAAYFIGDLSWPVALVFGAIAVVTGPTVIIPMLRHARLRRRPASYLKWEGIINDPIGALLAVVIFEYFTLSGTATLQQMGGKIGVGLLLASLMGVGSGYVLGTLYRVGLVPEYLKGFGALSAAIAVYVFANSVLSESGLLAATLLGITLGNMHLHSIDGIRRFKEYIALVLVSGLFILLTAELKPETLWQLDWRAAALLGAIIFLVRPISIFGSTIGSNMKLEERALLSWIAPRGIVAAAMAGVLGRALQAKGYPDAELLQPLIFSLILLTVLAHGLSIGWLGRRLDLSARNSNGVLIVGSSPWTVGLGQTLIQKKIPVMIVDSSWHRLRPARLAGIETYYGEILSEASEQQLEFNDYGFLLAATDNDAYNSLVCNRFVPDMGRNHVFQLPDISSDEPDPKRLSRTMRGLVAPAKGALYEDLMSRWYQKWSFQATTFSDSFSFEDWQKSRPSPEAWPILVAKSDRNIQLHSPDQPVKPKAGDMLVWFGPKLDRNEPSSNS